MREAPHRDLCTDCGISRSSEPKRCGRACQFIAPDYSALESRVHGRARDPGRTDETFFGPFQRMLRASLSPPKAGAQWTGITTRIAERLLETGAVDAVLTMRPDEADAWKPVPVLVTRAEDMAGCRGMRMGYAPLLALLEPAIARGYRRLAVIGIPCQVYALRALEQELGFERLYVIGTPCSDNTTTEKFHAFLDLVGEQLSVAPSRHHLPRVPRRCFQPSQHENRVGVRQRHPRRWSAHPGWEARRSRGAEHIIYELRAEVAEALTVFVGRVSSHRSTRDGLIHWRHLLLRRGTSRTGS